jgi:hypothetical protein
MNSLQPGGPWRVMFFLKRALKKKIKAVFSLRIRISFSKQ